MHQAEIFHNSPWSKIDWNRELLPQFRPILWEQGRSGRRDQRSKRWKSSRLSLDERRKQD